MHGTKWTQWIIGAKFFFKNTFILKNKIKTKKKNLDHLHISFGTNSAFKTKLVQIRKGQLISE